MRTIHIAEQSNEGLIDLQKTMTQLPWTKVRETIPYRSSSTRTHWALNAQEWLSENADDGWIGVVYIDDGVLFARFETASDASAFRAACSSEAF